MDVIEQTTDRWTRPRWWEWAPEAVLAVVLGYFFLDETDAATSAFRSTTALLFMVLGVLGWLGLRALLARFVASAVIRVAVLGVLAVAILAVVVLPAYRDTTVVEVLPIDRVATVEPGDPAGSSASPEPAPPVEPAMPPRIARAGSFRGIDHRASGAVNIYARTDGTQLVGLEEFDIQPGPDYDVYVVPGADRDDVDGGIRLDDLRGNVGTQFYDVPAGADLTSGEWTVLIWCQTFDVPIANATPV